METSVNLSRRNFFRAKTSARRFLRPPWAMPEAGFLAACTRCDACIGACPTQVVVRGDGGFPEIDFLRGECTFCRACLDACTPAALQAPANTLPWHYVAVIEETCLAWDNVVCRTCGDLCEAGAIRFRPQLGQAARPEIDLTLCTGCGACVAPCPSRAVRVTAANPGAMT